MAGAPRLGQRRERRARDQDVVPARGGAQLDRGQREMGWFRGKKVEKTCWTRIHRQGWMLGKLPRALKRIIKETKTKRKTKIAFGIEQNPAKQMSGACELTHFCPVHCHRQACPDFPLTRHKYLLFLSLFLYLFLSFLFAKRSTSKPARERSHAASPSISH